MIVRNDVTGPSNWRTTAPLQSWLAAHNLPGIAGIDTRSLTRHIRDNGAPKGALCYREDGQFDIEELISKWWPAGPG